MIRVFISILLVLAITTPVFAGGARDEARWSPSVSKHGERNFRHHSDRPFQTRVQLGPRPFFLVDDMDESALKRKLASCKKGPFRQTAFSIGHRGAPLQFPEHTRESYEAAARMGAGILECDVTFTADQELVCRHSQCDLHTTTNILATPLAGKCSLPFQPALYDAAGNLVRPARARCCTSDITLEEFKSLQGKMDTADTTATTVNAYMDVTAASRTDLYNNRGTLLSHRESIELFKKLGVGMMPELKAARVRMPFNGFTQQDYAQKIIEEYKAAGISPQRVWLQSFSLNDIGYWLDNEPIFAEQAVYLDDRYVAGLDHRNPNTWLPSMEDLVARGVNIIAPPMWMLLEVENGEIVPSVYATAAKQAGLDIVTWTLEHDGPLANGGGWTYQTINGNNPNPQYPEPGVIDNDGDIYHALHVLAQDVGILGVFSDWPASVTYYANCMSLK